MVASLAAVVEYTTSSVVVALFCAVKNAGKSSLRITLPLYVTDVLVFVLLFVFVFVFVATFKPPDTYIACASN